MVRKNPLNERGARPVPVKRMPTTLFELRPETDYHELWINTVLLTEKHVAALETYTNINMPGVNLSDLTVLRDRLDKLIRKVSK